DRNTGRYEPVAATPGFTRGLDFAGDLAFIGLSQVRESAVFSGIPITERLAPEERTCGVRVVDLRRGETVALLKFESGVQEVFAVAVLPRRFPDLIKASGRSKLTREPKQIDAQLGKQTGAELSALFVRRCLVPPSGLCRPVWISRMTKPAEDRVAGEFNPAGRLNCQATPKLTPRATLKLTPSWTLVKEGIWTTSTPIWLTCLTRRRTKRM